MTTPGQVSLVRRSVLLLGTLALLTYWPIVLGKVPFPADAVTQFPPWDSLRSPDYHPPKHAEMGDLVTELYPWKAYTRESIARGTLPLWNRFVLLGAPFLGDLQTGLFYPPNLIYYVLPTPFAWSLSILIRTVLAGLLAALLVRALGATRTAALTSGVIFAFCGWVTAFQTRPHLDTSLWLPLVLLSIDRLQRKPKGTSVALVALAFALPVLAGQPENAAHVTLVGLLFFVYRLVLPPSPPSAVAFGRGRFTALFAVGGILALALAAAQMLPALEFIGQIERTLGSSWGAKPLHEAGTFFSRDLGATLSSANITIPECAAYAGMLTLLVAPLALLHKNRRDAVFFATLVVCVLQIVYGRGPLYWISLRTPILRGIPNWRLLVVADLGLAVLAGLGLSALEKEVSARRRRLPARWWLLPGVALTLSALGVALILVRAKAGSLDDGIFSVSALRSPLSSAVVLAAAAALLGLVLAGRLGRKQFAVLTLGFVSLDLVTASYGFFPFTVPKDIFPPAPTFRFLKAQKGSHRVASVDMTWGPNFELMYGLESATGYTVLLRRVTRLLEPLGVRGDAPSFVAERIVQSRNRVLDLANVRYLAATTWNRSAEHLASRPDRFRLVFSDESVRVFENLSVLPRAFLVPASSATVLAGEDEQLAAVSAPGFDPTRTVILEGELSAKGGRAGAEGPAISNVTELEQRINDVSLRLDAAEPSILVLSQINYPGWKASVDDKEVPILKVNYAFVGLAVGTGSHAVRFFYSPTSFRIGAILSCCGLLICIALCLKRLNKGREPSPTS